MFHDRLYPLALCLSLACCGYSTRALLPPHLRSIAVLPVENQTLKPGIEIFLTDTLLNAFRHDGSLRIAESEQADILLSCRISSYEKLPQAYSSAQEVATWRIRVTATVECEDRVRNCKLWSGSVTGEASYDPATTDEDTGVVRALSQLGAEVVRRTLIAW